MGLALDALSDWVGIESEFVDALGQRQQTSPEKKRALLKAMALAADDEAQAQATLAELDRREWTRVLPSCVVLYEGKDLAVPVHLPVGDHALRWTVELEGGGDLHGEASFGALGQVHSADIDGVRIERRLLVLPADLPQGYHRLSLQGYPGAEASVIVTPGRCWLPGEDAEEETPAGSGRGRFWGVAAQVYLLRSERNWGIGDFSDLRGLVELVKAEGGDAVGVNPLHGMFTDLPEEASPYSPLSRNLLNVLNIDVEAIPEFGASEEGKGLVAAPEFGERLQRARAAGMVAYSDVAALKLPVLRSLFSEFESSGSAERKEAFERFQGSCDELLRLSCVYAAIREHLVDQDSGFRDSGRWPEALKDAASSGVEEFGRAHADLVRYQLWLQWVADEQLGAVKAACEGMAVGIYRDLAVGANPSGAEVWSNPGVMVGMAEVGAPPDILNTFGQNWVLPPFHPQRMREEGYRSFIALLRSNMRHAGGLRIDHAMALQRLYWIPRGGTPRDGGYVQYPIEDLVGIIALESHRNRCLVVGEDLGTVPPGFRKRMAEARILSYKVLLLEEEEKGGGYVQRSSYYRLALSAASNHDLPTLRGWWEEVDLDLRERLGFISKENVAATRRKREMDREAMLEMFRDEGLLEGKSWPVTDEFIEAAHRFLARTGAVLMMAQLEDIVEEAEQVNLPASMPAQYPSWSRRSAVTLEELARDGRLRRLAERVRAERGSGLAVE